LILKKDWQGILDARREKRISACGDGCVASALGTPSISGLEISLIDRGDSTPQQNEDTENRVQYAAISMK
jgi:AmmeMemoRadiSam system protein B